jgi:hypothetical protein
MFLHTNSLLLLVFGVVNSLLEFPVGYAIYRYVQAVAVVMFCKESLLLSTASGRN